MWSYLLMAVGVTGLWLAGRKSVWGWAVGFLAQFLWVVYALVTSQYGFIVSAVVYGFVYAKNFINWQRERGDEDQVEVSLLRDGSGNVG